ncbi:MAG TPA: glycosyltransferase family 4 protein [Candidatus Limnocylindria bacterium]|nr:glycosyltransferase family 4 protein [Candidatus Limnocylindria bacterium]
MKIAYINADPGVPVFGTTGCSVHVQEIILALLKRGAEVHLFATRMGDDAAADFSGLQIHPLPPLVKGDAVARERCALAANDALRTALEREAQNDAFDLVYERYSLWSCAGMEFAREREIKAILEVNAPLIEEGCSDRTLINREAAEEVAMRAFRCAQVITAVSRQLSHQLEQHPTARGKVHVVPNAVSPGRFNRVVPKYVKDKDDFVVGFVGMLKAGAGLTILIESFTQLAQKTGAARLLIVGDGPERERMDRELAARRLSDRVQFTGAVSPDEIPRLLASMDAAVAPYPPLTSFYGSPLKLYEYMAAGLPIVASRIGQIEEVIQNGTTGLLVPPGNAAALANALHELQLSYDLRARLGRAAREIVQQHTWDDIVRFLFSLVELDKEPVAPVAAR